MGPDVGRSPARIFQSYCLASGQSIDKAKSQLAFGARVQDLLRHVNSRRSPDYLLIFFLVEILGARTLCFKKWDDFYLQKADGGLGFRRFREFNLAMLGPNFGVSLHLLT